MSVALFLLSGVIGVFSSVAGAAMFGLGFWGGLALFFAVSNGLALLLITALMCVTARPTSVRTPDAGHAEPSQSALRVP